MLIPQEQLATLLRDLPDAEGARLFFEQITTTHHSAARVFARDHGLLSDALALAAWSPLLATTLIQHPEYLQWLGRERLERKVKTREELGEQLARFAATNSNLDPQILLARFRRRELLRITIRDIRRAATLVETTEELSNLADSILRYALGLAHQQLDNVYGVPLAVDNRGRAVSANFCIVALGKLGSRELNYASDIDLMFLYSDDGSTSGTGTSTNATTNREYFVRLAETTTRLVGHPSGEGAAYRVDLRLRPHGRVGALSCSLKEAARYYRETAQAWERQALIRARAAAGSEKLYWQFADEVRTGVYRADVVVEPVLDFVRHAKRKIDQQQGKRPGGFNVKLGQGGIREIEFIAQALQLAYGGRDTWLHAAHTLIALSRLADRRLITEAEKSELSEAYTFLRTLEHRLQIEHGLQTHTVPDEFARRAKVARRMGFAELHALNNFNCELTTHTTNVHAAFNRVFKSRQDAEVMSHSGGALDGLSEAVDEVDKALPQVPPTSTPSLDEEAEAAQLLMIANAFARRLPQFRPDREASLTEKLRQRIKEEVGYGGGSGDLRRARARVAGIARSLAKTIEPIDLSEEDVTALVRLCRTSEFFSEMIARTPTLVSTLTARPPTIAAVATTTVAALDTAASGMPFNLQHNYQARLLEAADAEASFGAKVATLRRSWARLLLEIGVRDAPGEMELDDVTIHQTALAEASINAAYQIAQNEMERRYGEEARALSLAVIGLGRLGSARIDYGSDLDVVLIYDDDDDHARSTIKALTLHETYTRFAELLVAGLSSVTRDGYMYRVDLRLRPDGKNGQLASGAGIFVRYLQERAAVWEWLAYIKLRAAAGDKEFGQTVERTARATIHEAARGADKELLRIETRRVRARLEQERVRPQVVDIKYGAGGMLDVYFATRYLQLRDNVPDDAGSRSTSVTLERLHTSGSLDDGNYHAFAEGYMLLRTLDHHQRLVVGRSTALPTTDHPALSNLARRAGFASTEQLIKMLEVRMTSIRQAYNRIMSGNGTI